MSFEYTTPAITKWKLDDFMEVIDQFNDALADNTHHKICIGHDYQTILVHIAGKSILTTKEILTLCAHGYPDGALSLGRNLYEQMMIGVSDREKRYLNFARLCCNAVINNISNCRFKAVTNRSGGFHERWCKWRCLFRFHIASSTYSLYSLCCFWY